ncbi:hypothetical protein R3W88_026774 [Solanum pinnatisectum]|uniref:Alkyl hydroperoxide reductase subunit C/ Thiol specific antioxidant domain-containing protein n=1 Tax=Solanum pinnatisectum TaxID=50273 RepID=A0AAV9LHL5_9SOLN|nr:hypothetical protein R3W88_026774 [Solanum pinnatisectum]
MPGLTIRDDLPNLQVETNHGKMKLHDYVGDSYTILFSHPGDFTPVCTMELAMMAALASSLREELNLWDFLVIMFSHNEWIKDTEAYNRELIKQLNMVDPDETDSSGNKLPSRALHIVGPDKKIILNGWIEFGHLLITSNSKAIYLAG